MVYGVHLLAASSPTWYVGMCVVYVKFSQLMLEKHIILPSFNPVVILMDYMVYGIRVYGKLFMVCTC
jgi:hypothetical protein